ncbi:hypothetical protein THZG08_510018 [Vibrio owensii]|nr:hypothetical protein THZG08_510018 [Vibrio owensii]CAH1584231.1 hypothetical protein THOA03_510019 [Vibrio owensii]
MTLSSRSQASPRASLTSTMLPQTHELVSSSITSVFFLLISEPPIWSSKNAPLEGHEAIENGKLPKLKLTLMYCPALNLKG